MTIEAVAESVRLAAIGWLTDCRAIALPMGDVHHGRTPLFDSRYDRAFTALPSFAAMAEALDTSNEITTRYGDAFGPRLLLGLAYDAIPRIVVAEPDVVEAMLGEIWRAFVAELATP